MTFSGAAVSHIGTWSTTVRVRGAPVARRECATGGQILAPKPFFFSSLDAPEFPKD